MTGQAMHVLGLSGGRDSAALAVWMRDHLPELNVQYFFTDTGKELPEVYDYLGRLEGFLGKTIEMLNPGRDFDFWLAEYGHFLPSPRTRWCTRQLKIHPFQKWLKPHLDAGVEVHSYVAIRAVHSGVQISVNHVPWRIASFVASGGCLLVMIAREAVALL